MVDWDAVARRRAQGWDWDRIAQDPEVGFRPVPRPDHPGTALRAIYERRQRDARGRPPEEPLPPSLAPPPAPRWTLARVGYLLVPFFGIWALLAYGLAAPVGTYLPAIPIVALLFAVAAFLLAFGLLKTSPRWNARYRNAVLAGTLAGVVVGATLGGIAALQGAPVLTPFVTSEPGSWEKLPNSAWTEQGAPVVFFLGSVACPYCSASSWAVVAALSPFGNFSGLRYSTSSSTDVYPDTPEVVLAYSTFTSRWVAWDPLESTNPNTVELPTMSNIVEQSYVSAYDSEGSLPFLVVGGQYAHVGSLVDPGPLDAFTASDIFGQILNETGPAWEDIAPAVYLLEAFLWKADGGQPAAVGENPNVAAILRQIG